MNAIKPQFAQYPMVIAALALLSACDRNQGKVHRLLRIRRCRSTSLSCPRARSRARSCCLRRSIALQEATLYAKVSGYLKSIAVDKGDKVAAGAVLARIEIPELVASRAKQQAELKAAQADYNRLQESLQKAPDLIVPEMVDQARGAI